jgi:UDP-N-acetylmuramoyl-tripeptide--D-alanyl-D-alanine ligase
MKSGAVMDSCSLSFVVQACAGLLRNGTLELTVRRVCTDSRQVQPGDLFVALAGGRFDGHGFLSDVAAKGAVAALVCSDRVAEAVPGLALIEVADTRVALGKLAAAYRLRFNLAVAAVAGSNGKTTTKELIASVLRQRLCTLWSEASFNNDIGVPLSLLRLEERHQAAVLEVGTNHPGELAPLVRMIRPQYGIITSIGREHLEFFGDLEGVAREEGTLGELLPARGVLFLNGDCEWSEALARRSPAQIVRVGFSERNDWCVTDYRSSPEGVSFSVKGPGEASEHATFSLKLLGKHQIVNALFAVALGRDLGIPITDIQRGLAQCQPPRMRMEVWEHNGVRVLDDAYNANADSMLAALETLRDVPCKGRRVAVLGDMAELGAHSLSAHQEVGRGAAELGVGQLFAVGKMAPIMGEAARRAGLTRVLEFLDVESAAKAVRSFVKEGDVLLVKASRATRLERVSEALRRN